MSQRELSLQDGSGELMIAGDPASPLKIQFSIKEYNTKYIELPTVPA